MFPNNKFMIPFLQLIKALAVAKNGRQKVTGIGLYLFIIDFVSKTIKFTWYMNLSTWSKTSSIISFGTLTDLLTSKRVVEVGFNSPRLSC